MLYLSYDNTSHKDGFASQLQRMLSIYCLAKEFGCAYLHNGFLDIEYQGLLALENNQKSEDFVRKANEIFPIASAEAPSIVDKVVKMTYFSPEIFSEATTQNIVVYIVYAHKYIDTQTSVFRHLPSFSWISPVRDTKKPLQIAVHVRRGELFLVDSNRLLPNEYFLHHMYALVYICKSLGLNFAFTVYTEKPTQPRVISPQYHGMCDRFAADSLIYPGQTDISLFENHPHTVCKVNTDPFEAFQEMCQADILICSLSSFSYTAGLLNKQGHILMPKQHFWHGVPESWIDTDREGDFMKLLPLLQDR